MSNFNIGLVEKDCRDGRYTVEVGSNGYRRRYTIYFGNNTRGSSNIFYSAGRWLVRASDSGTMRIPRRRDLENVGFSITAFSKVGKQEMREAREAIIASICNG